MIALKITHLEKTYWKNKVLKNIWFEVKSWDFFALLWVNGAGKSTLIGIITDLVKKTSGKVEVFWVDIDTDFSQAKKYIWVVPQELNLDIFSKVIDVLIQSAGYFGISKAQALPKASELLQELWLQDKVNHKIMQLSGGMKRRVMIARALMHSPKLLILDEPTAGIDINLRKTTYSFLKKLNQSWVTIILTTHYLEEVEKLCNTLAVIKQWEILFHSSKKYFFAQVSKATYEIELDKSFTHQDDFWGVLLSQGKNIVLKIEKLSPMGEIFSKIESLWYKIISIRNTTNELETLFESL